MFKKAIHFVKYNNLVVLILVIIFLLSTGVFAQTEAGQAVIGAKQTSIEGVDNTLLLEADLDALDMDFKIEKIEADEKYYYVTHTFIDLVRNNNVWQYQMQEKVRKISKRLKKDLGMYLAEELGEEYEARIKELKEEQDRAGEQGESKRIEVTEFSGLIGRTLNLAGKIFPNYEPVVKTEIPSPTKLALQTLPLASGDNEAGEASSGPDNLTQVYLDYIRENDPDEDNVFGSIDNCPYTANPEQMDSDGDGIGDACETLTPSPSPTSGVAGEGSIATSSVEDVTGEETATTTEETVADQLETATSTTADATDITPIDTPIDEEEPSFEEATEDEPDVEIIELPVAEEVAGEMIEEAPIETEEPLTEEASN